jgi:hypothetical protein
VGWDEGWLWPCNWVCDWLKGIYLEDYTLLIHGSLAKPKREQRIVKLPVGLAPSLRDCFSNMRGLSSWYCSEPAELTCTAAHSCLFEVFVTCWLVSSMKRWAEVYRHLAGENRVRSECWMRWLVFGSGMSLEWLAARIKPESSCSCGCIARLVAVAGAEEAVELPNAVGDGADVGVDAGLPAAGVAELREVTRLLRRHRVLPGRRLRREPEYP